jgi:hypothetical protein
MLVFLPRTRSAVMSHNCAFWKGYRSPGIMLDGGMKVRHGRGQSMQLIRGRGRGGEYWPVRGFAVSRDSGCSSPRCLGGDNRTSYDIRPQVHTSLIIPDCEGLRETLN